MDSYADYKCLISSTRLFGEVRGVAAVFTVYDESVSSKRAGKWSLIDEELFLD
jgi:hypothetical protein